MGSRRRSSIFEASSRSIATPFSHRCGRRIGCSSCTRGSSVAGSAARALRWWPRTHSTTSMLHPAGSPVSRPRSHTRSTSRRASYHRWKTSFASPRSSSPDGWDDPRVSVTRVILPKLGLTMDEGRLIAWHKKEGERVEKGEVLFEIETDKANMEIEASASGIVRRILLPADASAPVATVIALIADTADEPLPASVAPAPSPLARNDSPAGTGPPLAGAAVGAEASDRVRSSPAARKRAQELGVDINLVRGTGPGGRVGLEDVEAAAALPAPSPSTSASSADSGGKREPLTRMRRAAAEAMTRSAREAPQFSISRDVDMTRANAKREAP